MTPEDMVDLAELGAIKLAQGVVNKSVWAKQMVTEHGIKSAKQLENLWSEAHRLVVDDKDGQLRRSAILSNSFMEIPKERHIEVPPEGYKTKEIVPKVTKFAEDNGIIGKHFNRWDKKQIEVTKNGIDHALSWAGPQKVQLIGILPEMIKEGIPVATKPNYKNPRIIDHVYATKVRMDGEKYVVGLMIHEVAGPKGKPSIFYYDHAMTEMKRLGSDNPAKPDLISSGKGQDQNRASVISIIGDFVKGKSENITTYSKNVNGSGTWLDKLQQRKDDIRKRLTERQMRNSKNPMLDGDPTAKRGIVADVGDMAANIADLGELVAIRIAEGALNKAAILKEVIEEFGPEFRAHAEKIWSEGQRYFLKNKNDLLEAVKATPETIPDDDFVLPKEIGIGRKVWRAVGRSGGKELRKQGQAGRRLAKDLESQRKAADMLKGHWQNKLEDAMEGLTGKERIEAGEVQEGLRSSGNPKVSEAARKLGLLLDEIGERAELSALDIRTPDGKAVPFKRRKNYFPRIHDLDKLTKAKHRTRALKYLVETGQAKNLADADRMLEGYLKGKGERRAGNLENARILDLPDYEKDPLKAVGKYIDGAARRLTESDTFGKKDELAKNLIEKVRREGGDWRYAQEVFDLMVGTKKYKSKLVDLASKFNIVTKLDLSFITNATQPVNTAVKTGVVNTLDAILKTYVTDRKGSLRFAREAGTVEAPATMGKEGGLSIGRVMETILTPFSYVEKKNRVSAAVAGKLYAEKLTKKILKNPTNAQAIRQLKSLGIDAERILAEGKITPEDILGAAYENTKATQFKVDAIDVPPAWKTNIGRLLTQFRSFSFRQTIFVRDEVLKEARHGNFLPMIRLIALGVPASFVASSVRNAITGRNLDEDNLDVRKLDNYLKAVGTIPTDLITQGEFIYDTFKNPYASPLKKTIRVGSSLLGPTFGEAGGLMLALSSIGDVKKANQHLPKGKKPGDPYLELKRKGASYIPFVGEYLKNTAFAYPKDNVGDFIRVIRSMEDEDRSALGKALRAYRGKQQSMILQNAAVEMMVQAEKEGDAEKRKKALRFLPSGWRSKVIQRARKEIAENEEGNQ